MSQNDPSDALWTAEYSALRAEILGHQNAQTTIVGANLAAIGVVLGLVLTEKQTRVELLLVVPLVASGLGLLYANHTRAGLLLGNYIADNLWPGGQSWEHYLREYRKSWKPVRLLEFMGGAAVFFLPSLGALIALLVDGVWKERTLFVATFWCAVALMAVHVILTIVLAVESRKAGGQPAAGEASGA
jgi:hypothetical protein